MQDLTQPISKATVQRRVQLAERVLAQTIERHQQELARAEQRLAEARELVPVPKPRIDTLKPGQRVRLFFASAYGNAEREEDVEFLGVTGSGDDREASFRSDVVSDAQPDPAVRRHTVPFEWNAYRYEGHWAYGSSADRLSLVSVLPDDDTQSLEEWGGLREVTS